MTVQSSNAAGVELDAQAPSRSAGIILSGTYVINSLVAEFGLLPPAFLPVANRRLYQLQAEQLQGHVDEIIMALPQGFNPEFFDHVWMTRLGIKLFSAVEASLGSAVAACISSLPATIEDIWIYYGDTLVNSLEGLVPDSAMVGKSLDYQRWGFCKTNADGINEFYEQYAEDSGDHLILSGCFRFSRGDLQRCLMLANDDFFAALNIYSMKSSLTLVPLAQGWHDFGHLQTYFRSRQNFTAERDFNLLQIANRKVSKYSRQDSKMQAEAHWFASVPPALKVFLPAYLGEAQRVLDGEQISGYRLEYLYLTPLNDLYVFGRLPNAVWQQIAKACREFLETCGDSAGPVELVPVAERLYAEKTAARLEDFARQRGIDLDRTWTFNRREVISIRALFKAVSALLPPVKAEDIRVSHGDFHFANIFFDSRSLGIKTFDPRGTAGDTQTIFGDCRYDIAKLAHSVYGLYDYIVSGIIRADIDLDTYEMKLTVPSYRSIRTLRTVFNGFEVNGYKMRSVEIQAIVIMLFLSMLPLHADDPARQDTFLANAYRLATALEKVEVYA